MAETANQKEMWPTTSENKYVNIKYGAHIAVMTGKEGEAVCIDNISTFEELFSALDKKYPGFKNLFMPPDDIFTVRTMITRNRRGTVEGIEDPQDTVKDGDTLLLM
jgi:molybdopterin converting factor small subunit